MKINIILCVFLFSFLYSCLKESKIIIKQDFENAQNRWNNVNIIKGSAHSGSFYTSTDSINNYSACFSKNISEISDKKLNRIDVITWIRKADKRAQGGIIISLDRGTTPIFWKSTPIDAGAPQLNEWNRMYISYDLPDSIGKNEILKVYILNKDRLPVDADDFEIRLYY